MRRLLLFLACSNLCFGATYFVSNTGSDAANGTSTSTPWQTIAHVNGQTFSAGDSILFQSGNTWQEKLIPPSSGTSGSPITFGSYGTGARPIIDGNGTIDHPIYVFQKNYVVVTNLEIKNATSAAIYLADCSNDTIQQMSIHDSQGQGIYADTTGGGHLIQNNEIYNVGLSAVFGGGSGIQLHVATGVSIIQYNYIHDLGNAVGGDHAIYDESPNDVDRFNYMANVLAGTAMKVDADGIQIYGNIFDSIANGGVYIDPFSNVKVYNNTFYNCGTSSPFASILFIGDGTQSGTSAENNIIYVSSGFSEGIIVQTNATGFSSNYNDVSGAWYGQWVGTDYQTLSAWTTATGQDANSISSNPLLTNPSAGLLTLQPTSPAIGTGVNLGSQNALLPNATWPANVYTASQRTAWNMGAYLVNATFYVSNSGSDGNNGTSSATPWQTISHVNSQAFNPGDSVLFQAGGTWREQLTAPSSGSTGNPITFGKYGTGAQPTISGADLVSNWTAYTATQSVKDTFGTIPATGGDNRFNSADSWFAGNFTPSSSYTMVAIAAQMKIGSGTPFTSPVTAYIYSDNAGLPGTLIATAVATIQPTLTTTFTPYSWSFSPGVALTGATKYWLVLNTAITSGSFASMGIHTDTGNSYYFGNNGTTWTAGFASNSASIQTYVTGTAAPNVWQATVSATPSQVFKNGVLATEGASINALTEGQWFASGTTLYYHESAGNPGSQGYTIEASSRNRALDTNGKNNLTFDNIHFSEASFNDVYIGNPSTSVTVQNSLLDKSFCTALTLQGAALTNDLIQDNELTGNNATNTGGCIGVSGIDVDGGTSVGGVIVQNNYVHDNYLGAAIECDQFASGCIVRYNTSATNGIGGSGGSLTTDNHANALFEYNTVYGNTGFCMFLYSETFASVTGGQIVHNTCYNNSAGGIVTESQKVNLSIENNVLEHDGTTGQELSLGNGSDTSYTNVVINHNDYFPNAGMANPWSIGSSAFYDAFSTWKTSGYDAASVSANPLFTNPGVDFTIQSSSPARNAGMFITGINQQISEGIPDMGANEYAPGKLGTNAATKLNNRFKVATLQ